MPPSLVRHNQAMPSVLPASGDRKRRGRTSGKTDPNQCSPALFHHAGLMWNPIADTPYGRRLALAVIDKDGVHALVFACERVSWGWKNAETGERVNISPTHWRDWNAAPGDADSSADRT